jgi:hypothetical protein
VRLDGRSILCGDASGKALNDIVSIQVWPFCGSDGPDSGFCDIRFSGGATLRITSMGRSGAISRERDLAYAAFLGRLHAALSAEARTRIAFLDGIQGGGSGLIAIAVLFCGPVIVLCFYAAFTRGQTAPQPLLARSPSSACAAAPGLAAAKVSAVEMRSWRTASTSGTTVGRSCSSP